MSKKRKLEVSMGLKSCDKCEYYLRCEECVGSHYREETPKLNNKISDLEAKLAESEKKQEYLFSSICEYVYQIEELKQQLAEKDETIDEINREFVQSTHDWKEIVDEKIKAKTEFAIEKLQRVKENCQAFDGIELVGFIDQIIKELEGKVKKIKFVLNGCDISFIAEAPEDITLKQLLKQCDKIKPDWCACGIRSVNEEDYPAEAEIIIDYDSVKKSSEDVSCRIIEGETK